MRRTAAALVFSLAMIFMSGTSFAWNTTVVGEVDCSKSTITWTVTNSETTPASITTNIPVKGLVSIIPDQKPIQGTTEATPDSTVKLIVNASWSNGEKNTSEATVSVGKDCKHVITTTTTVMPTTTTITAISTSSTIIATPGELPRTGISIDDAILPLLIISGGVALIILSRKSDT